MFVGGGVGCVALLICWSIPMYLIMLGGKSRGGDESSPRGGCHGKEEHGGQGDQTYISPARLSTQHRRTTVA